MDREQRKLHHLEREESQQLQAALPPQRPTATGAGARGGRSRALLWSFAALFIASVAVLLAVLLMQQNTVPKRQPSPPAAIVPASGGPPQLAAKESSRQLSGDSAAKAHKRVTDHLVRAKKQIASRKWRAALFFLDQVLILDSGHAEARKLLVLVESKVTKKAVAPARVRPALARAEASTRKPQRAVRPQRPRRAPARRSVAQPPAARRAAVRRAGAGKKLALRSTKQRAKAKPGKSPRAAAPPRLLAKQAGLQVTSRPSSMVYLDGIPLGPTPLKGLRLAPGLHVVKLLKGGYRTYLKHVTLEEGKERLFHVELRAKAKQKPARNKRNK